jgi:hypothetical protein
VRQEAERMAAELWPDADDQERRRRAKELIEEAERIAAGVGGGA